MLLCLHTVMLQSITRSYIKFVLTQMGVMSGLHTERFIQFMVAIIAYDPTERTIRNMVYIFDCNNSINHRIKSPFSVRDYKETGVVYCAIGWGQYPYILLLILELRNKLWRSQICDNENSYLAQCIPTKTLFSVENDVSPHCRPL